MKETKLTGYFLTFALLLGMAFLNIFISQQNLGGMNTAVIFGIASVQAFILAAFFMHLRESPKFMWIIVISGFFFVGVLAVYVVADNHGRTTQPKIEPWELRATVEILAPNPAK